MGIPVGMVDHTDSRIVDYTSARQMSPSRSSCPEFNGRGDQLVMADVGDNSETNCESASQPLMMYFFELSDYGEHSWFRGAAYRPTTTQISHTKRPPP